MNNLNWGIVTPKSSADVLAENICKICKSNTGCINESICTMAYIEAEKLEEIGYKLPEPRKLLTASWIPKAFDVVTLKKGFSKSFSIQQPTSWECSNCKHEVNNTKEQNYCSKCGAIMDLCATCSTVSYTVKETNI